LEEELDNIAVRHHCNLYSHLFTKEALERFRDFKIGQVSRMVKYADELVLLAKEDAVIQSMSDRLNETGICYGIEMNVKKTKVIRISRQPSPLEIMIDQKQPENVKYFNYVCSMITNDKRCTCEIKSRIAITKAAF